MYRTRSGKIITDTDIEALADEAERGYDPNDFVSRKETFPEFYNNIDTYDYKGKLHNTTNIEGYQSPEKAGRFRCWLSYRVESFGWLLNDYLTQPILMLADRLYYKGEK